jgi:hypothetical protein
MGKHFTEADLWKKIRDLSRRKWVRLDNVNVSGVFDCLFFSRQSGMALIELKCGKCFKSMLLRKTQHRFAKIHKVETKRLFVLRYNFANETAQLEQLYASPDGQSKFFEIKKLNWLVLIRQIEDIIDDT